MLTLKSKRAEGPFAPQRDPGPYAQVDWTEAEGEGQQVAHAIGERSGSVLGLRKHQSDGDPAGHPTGDNSHYQRHGRDNDRDQRGGLALTLPREYEETIVRSCGKAH